MKIRLNFKTPDVLYYALKDVMCDEEQQEEIKQICEKFVEYGECLTVEIDTEKKTATVIPV